eukprot:CAMPEP_0197183896 /NCGR_PEP_ID=MMETSP1423-20130617/8729_1 /TAXON_ID=476441 /ORGANISM="Pseudo-nitzschia heimii, Strain UNC1101" /LENGTH=168 /DNA_ID=CAMNT_0042634565 /DNA_START=74 /DNA_END=580 /DNA_ORIENTATION=-
MINTSSESHIEMVEAAPFMVRCPEQRRFSRYALALVESDAEGKIVRSRIVDGRDANYLEQEALSERSVNSIIDQRLESVEHQMFLNKAEKSEQVKDRKLIRKDRRKRRRSRLVRELKRSINGFAHFSPGDSGGNVGAPDDPTREIVSHGVGNSSRHEDEPTIVLTEVC